MTDISKRLITDGSCIAGGKRCVWYGTITTFIKIEYIVGNFDCYSYTFDLAAFLVSDFFIQERNRKLKSLEEEMGKTLEQFNEIQSL